jgi:heme a synthase
MKSHSVMGYSPMYFRLAIAASCLAVVVVLLGAFTRLADAGLGCPDWPTCYGHLWVPSSEADIASANQQFADTPVETDKTWPEQFHRIVAGTLGLLVLGLAVCAWRERRSMVKPHKLAYFLCVLIVIQALFGMWTVTLKLWPQVVTAHLLGGFATLSLLWLMVQRLGDYQWHLGTMPKLSGIKRWAVVSLLIVIVQIMLGGWTSSNYAALACMDLPTCQGYWLPDMNFSQGFNLTQHIGPNYLGGMLDNEARVAIHFSHRIGAIITAAVILFMAYQLWWMNTPQSRRWGLILISVLALQVGLGVTNILAAIPLPVAVAHNGVGALLLLVMVTINHRLFTLRRL